MVAAGKGREEEAMVLLANGADPRLRAKDGSSAADWADRSAPDLQYESPALMPVPIPTDTRSREANTMLRAL